MHDFPTPTSTTIQKQKEDFLRIFGDEKEKQEPNQQNNKEEHGGIQHAYSKALTGDLRGSRIRGLCWKLFFGIVDIANLSASMRKQRKRYEDLKNRHLVDPRKHAEEMDLEVCNPLSQSDDNPWQSFFAQEDLESIIRKDLQRLFPEHELFAKPEVQETLLSVLMVYSLDNPDLSYRQGMHEILGGIYYAMASDAQCTAAGVSSNPEEIPETLQYLTSEDGVEADCFLVFDQVMNAIGEFFHSTGPESETPILLHCSTLQDEYLQSHDPCLANHLRDHGVEPQFYAIKWFRLLFGRDFHLEDVLVLWDAMFAEADLGPDNTVRSLPLMPHLAVAMLVYIRLDLLAKDNSGCLRRLMHYPPVEDVVPFVERARQSLKGKVLPLPVSTEPSGDTTPVNKSSYGAQSHHQQQQQQSTSGVGHSGGGNVAKRRPQIPTISKLGGSNKDVGPSPEQLQIRRLTDTMQRMGSRVEGITTTLQQYAQSGSANPEDLYLAIAELKQIKDVLNGDIEP